MQNRKPISVAAHEISGPNGITSPDATRKAAKAAGVLEEVDGKQTVPDWWIKEAGALYRTTGFFAPPVRRRTRPDANRQT